MSLAGSRVCADDYGLSPGVGRAIRELVAENRINAVSCLVTFPESGDELNRLKKVFPSPQVGLHLSLTAGQPCFDPGTKFESFFRLGVKSAFRIIDLKKTSQEIGAQLEKFIRQWGKAPDFIDGHQHVHQLPVIRDALVGVMLKRFKDTARPSVRVAGQPREGQTFRDRGLGFLGKGLRSRLKHAQIPANRFLFGYIDPASTRAREKMLSDFRRLAGPNDIIYFHPGYVDESLTARDPLTTYRLDELKFLRQHFLL